MCVFLRESSSMLQSQLVACQSGHFIVFVSHFRKVALYCSWNYALNSPIDVFASFRLSSALKKKKKTANIISMKQLFYYGHRFCELSIRAGH